MMTFCVLLCVLQDSAEAAYAAKLHGFYALQVRAQCCMYSLALFGSGTVLPDQAGLLEYTMNNEELRTWEAMISPSVVPL